MRVFNAGLRQAIPHPCQRILAALSRVESASRGELQKATGASGSGVTKALGDLIPSGLAEPTAPPRSPGRRYRRK